MASKQQTHVTRTAKYSRLNPSTMPKKRKDFSARAHRRRCNQDLQEHPDSLNASGQASSRLAMERSRFFLNFCADEAGPGTRPSNIIAQTSAQRDLADFLSSTSTQSGYIRRVDWTWDPREDVTDKRRAKTQLKATNYVFIPINFQGKLDHIDWH